MNKDKKTSTGRKCSVCSHDQIDKINSQIAQGKSFRSISLDFGMSDVSVHRHAQNHLKLEIRALIKEKKVKKAIDHYEEIWEQLELAKDLRIAAREYLTDPDTGKISLIPRSDEVSVFYYDRTDTTAKGEPKKKREKLQVLLNKIDGTNLYQSDRVELKHVDIRSFALNAIQTVDAVLDKVAKVSGLYKQDAPNESTLEIVAQAIKDHLREYPDHPPGEVIRIFAEKGKVDVDKVYELLD